MSEGVTRGGAAEVAGSSGAPGLEPAGSQQAPERGPGWAVRLTDRTLWTLLAVGLAILLVAIGFALWINAAGPLQPVPVASRPSA